MWVSALAKRVSGTLNFCRGTLSGVRVRRLLAGQGESYPISFFGANSKHPGASCFLPLIHSNDSEDGSQPGNSNNIRRPLCKDAFIVPP